MTCSTSPGTASAPPRSNPPSSSTKRHEVKGQGIYAYVILNVGVEPSEELRKALIKTVRTEIGPIASPDIIHFSPGLPKTRSGKIMRRILRKIAEGRTEELGDTSTLADPSVVRDLVEGRK